MSSALLRGSRLAFGFTALCLIGACGSDERVDQYRDLDPDAGANYGGPETGFPDAIGGGGDASGDASRDGATDSVEVGGVSDVLAKDTNAAADGNLDAVSGDAQVALPL